MYDSEEIQNSSEYSELDASKHGIPRSTQLKDDNDQLLKENTVLRSQFEDAIKITKQLEELHAQNSDLLATIRTLRSEKDDLQHRLDISLQSCKEMQARLNDEKRSCTSIRGTDLNTMSKEIEKIKQQSKAQLDSIYDQLEKAKQATERESVEKRLLASKLDHILEDSQRFFSHNFANIDEFMCFLATPPVAQEQAVSAPPPQVARALGVAQPADAKLEKKVKHLKNKLKQAVSSNASLEEAIKRAQQEGKSESNVLRSQVKTLESQLSAVAESKSQVESQLNYQIQALSQKNSSLTKKVDQLNEQLRTQTADLKHVRKELAHALATGGAPAPTSLFNDSDTTVPISRPIVPRHTESTSDDVVMQRNQELNDQVVALQRKADELKRDLQSADSRYNNLSIALEKSKADYNAIQRLHEADKAEIDSLRSALHTKEVVEQEIRNKNKNRPKEPSARILKLQKALDSEKQKVYALQTNESKLTTKIDDLEAQLRLANQGVQEAENETRKAQNELADVRRQIESTTPLTADDLLPPCVFVCEEFDPTLSSAIVRIANNAALQPVSKLQNCFKTIRKHFGKQIQARDEALDQAFAENQTLSNAFNQFLVDASIALNDNAITLQDFFAQNAGQKIVEQVTSIRANLANLRHQYDTLKGFITLFHNSLGDYFVEPTDTVKQMNEVRTVIESQKAAITARSKKIHELKAIIRQTAATLKNKEVDYDNQLHELQDTIKELQCSHTALETVKRQLKADNDNLTQQLQQVTQEREQLESTIVQDNDVHNTSLIDDFAKQESSLKGTIKSQDSQIHQLRQTIANLEGELTKHKSLITSLKAARKQRDIEYADLQRVLSEHDQAAINRLETERRNITSSFENAVNELKEQCEKHRNDVQKMAVQVSETELKNSQICQEISQVRKDKRKMEIELAGTKAQLEREKKLMESTVRAQKVAAESQYNAKLEEQRTKAEVERRRLFALGADAFRSFFNPSEQIDERSFKCVLDKARETITKLSKSDLAIRRMLGAAEQQTTQDAVAQLLMAKGCTA
ncbi:hypothetical protein TRFO_32317 [Tritrichomonas foetus]|uniref:Uncharacterized protein n=1 Tax=Tritrichomonas foetus TaxID=1144522 RepID=A0A1J4JPD4_9EUKA|nr:hypothetical protein [Tritrichomonas foetus]OHT00891.1 hypothetical protein TRFO_32317 [Tritrichomonas foetus]|eukprot:OHT00891.1 hypothetical protein TRFO_32317 [Tritrichomonas foetus]